MLPWCRRQLCTYHRLCFKRLWNYWQPWQVIQTPSASLSPGHHTVVCKRCFIATIPAWFGNTIQAFPIALNSPRTCRYSLNSIAYHLPFKRHSHTIFSSGSCSDALSIARVVKATGVDSWATHFTYSSASFSSLDCGTGHRRHDIECAMFLGPSLLSRKAGKIINPRTEFFFFFWNKHFSFAIMTLRYKKNTETH